SGLVLASAFPPLDLEFLGWIGLVPLLRACRGVGPRAAFGTGWLGGAVFYLAIVYWVVHTISAYSAVPFALAVAILLLMVSVLACYMGAFTAGLAWLAARGLPVVWLAPPLWVALEWLRSWFFIGFPWAALGYSQYRYHDLAQMAEVTGVYGISAVLVLFNLVAVAVLGERGPGLRRLVPALAVLTLLVTVLPVGGWRRAAATYDKTQLVPFGEYVPFEAVLFFVQRLVVAIGDVVPGHEPTVFRLPAGRFGVLICYEDVFPALTRRFVAGGADFLVNVTNDAWFGRTSAPYQHLAQATLRAV